MFKRLRRLLGWEHRPEPPARADARRGAAVGTRARKPAIRSRSSASTTTDPTGSRPVADSPERDPFDLLDHPGLSLDTSEQAGFDPYNTGVFDRSASWEKISRSRSR